MHQGDDAQRHHLDEGDGDEVGEALAAVLPAAAGQQRCHELAGEVDAGQENPDRQPPHGGPIIIGFQDSQVARRPRSGDAPGWMG
jgi:hypothetical protein